MNADREIFQHSTVEKGNSGSNNAAPSKLAAFWDEQ
jgi:hypothetical protein